MTAAPSAPATPDPRPQVWPAFVGFCCALFGGQLIGTVIIGGMFLADFLGSGVTDDPEVLLRDPDILARGLTKFVTKPSTVVVGAAVTSLTMVAASLIGARLSRTPATERLRLGPGSLSWGKSALATFGGVALGVLCGNLMSLLHLDGIGVLDMMQKAFSVAPLEIVALSVLFVGVSAPIGEEMFFRGFMQTRLSQRWRRWSAIAMTAMFFGLMHLDPVQGPMAFVLGLYLGWITELGGSIRVAIAAHAANNCLSVLLTRLAPGPTPLAVDIAVPAVAAVVFVAAVLTLRSKPAPALAPSPEAG